MVVLVLFFLLLYGDHRDIPVRTHSFPTGRSSELAANHHVVEVGHDVVGVVQVDVGGQRGAGDPGEPADAEQEDERQPVEHRRVEADRSEEHTSELQSLMRISYAVFCLKKKKKVERS